MLDCEYQGTYRRFAFSDTTLKQMVKEGTQLDTSKCPELWAFVKKIGEYVDPMEEQR